MDTILDLEFFNIDPDFLDLSKSWQMHEIRNSLLGSTPVAAGGPSSLQKSRGYDQEMIVLVNK